MNKVICVYSSSSSAISAEYFQVAAALGQAISRRGDTMLYGGGLNGLMGAVAKAVHQTGGRVVGVIPEALNVPGVVYENCDELIITQTLRERKAIMDQRSEAFIALPGGYGTLEELLEIITLKQLRHHQKPIVIINSNGFYDWLLKQFEQIISERFAKPESEQLYYTTDTVQGALDYIEHYQPFQFTEKWLTDVAPPE